jgi:hypothetical protein
MDSAISLRVLKICNIFTRHLRHTYQDRYANNS